MYLAGIRHSVLYFIGFLEIEWKLYNYTGMFYCEYNVRLLIFRKYSDARKVPKSSVLRN